LWLADIFSRYTSESDYIEYLENNKIFFDDDFFLFSNDDSLENAKNNVQKLIELYED